MSNAGRCDDRNLSSASRDSRSADIVIFGAGGHAKVVVEAIRAASPHFQLAIADDSADAAGRSVCGIAVAGGRAWLTQNRPMQGVVPAVGNNEQRLKLLEWLSAERLPVLGCVHPTAVVSASASLGAGVFIAPGAVVNAEARLGQGAIINTAASVDHDCHIGVAAHIGPGAHLCGNVRIGPRTLVGAGTTIIPGIRVGKDVVIGAGSTVIRDVLDGTRVAGSPARPV